MEMILNYSNKSEIFVFLLIQSVYLVFFWFFRNILHKNWSFESRKSAFDAQNFNVNLKSEIIYPRID